MAETKKAVATTKQATQLENLISEGVKLVTSQEAVNAVSIATAAATFLDLSEKQAAAVGVGFALLQQHLDKKDGAF